MYVILVYDVTEDKVFKVCQYLRQYLNWVQNSVFEGELTNSEFIMMQEGLSKIINIEKDSIRVYITKSEKNVKKILIGKRYKEPSQII